MEQFVAKKARRVTIKDVAAEAGVSIALVSLVLHSKIEADGRNNCNVRKETALTILNTVKKLGYIPNNAAASMRTGHSKTIVVITSNISSPIFSELCRIIENYAYDHGYNVIFASSDENPEKFSNIMRSALGRNVDGMVILPPPSASTVLGRFTGFNVPVVLLERDVLELPEAGRVLLDNAESIRLGFEALYASGHRKIAMIASDMDISTIKDRVETYKKLMDGKGLGRDTRIFYLKHHKNIDEILQILSESKENGTEAFILPSNDITNLFILAVNKLHLKVPKDLAFVGLGKSMIYDFIEPSVAYIHECQDEMAEKAVSMLIDMIEGNGGPSKYVLSPKLVEGGSIGSNL